MPIMRGLRVINSVEAGTTNAAQLETLLSGDAGRKAEFNAVTSLKGQAKRMAAGSTTMTAMAGSSTAMSVIAANPTAQGEVAQSSIAMTTVLSTSTGREAFFGSIYSVGKGLDTVIYGNSSVNDGTLQRQMTFANVVANSASTITADSSVATAVGQSPTARAAIIANEAGKQNYAVNTVSVAKFIEGELGGNPATTTSLDAVLNTTGRLASILANANAKAIASAASPTSAKLLAKIISLDPTLFSDITVFYGDATRWSSVSASSDGRSVCYNSKYLMAILPFSKKASLIIAGPLSESKALWNWNSGAYGNTYFGSTYGTNILSSVAWSYNGVHYILFNVYSGSGSTYGIFALSGWTSADSSAYLTQNYPTNALGYAQNNIYGMRAVGTKFLVAGNNSTGNYWSSPLDFSGGMQSITSGQASAIFYDFAFGNSYYVAATNSGLYYSSTAAASSWTLATGTNAVNFQFIGYALNKFIAITIADVVWTSTNGTSFTNSGASLPSSISAGGNLPYSKFVTNGTILFLFNKPANKLFSSTNGTTWATVTLPDSAATVNGIHYDGATFYLATEKGFYTSTDGTTWTINSAVTTYAKMGNLNGTDKFMMALSNDTNSCSIVRSYGL